MRRPTASAAAVVLGLFTLVLGAWAMVAPRSFFDALATFPPYNEHLLHDVGAFQIGIGTTLLLAVRWSDALGVALGGTAVGFTLHFVSHAIDTDLGGRATDPVAMAVLAAIAAWGVWRFLGKG